MPGPVFLRGDGVTLRPVEEPDYAFLRRHWNHPEVRPGFGAVSPTTDADAADRVESITESDDSETFLVCADGENAADERVGEAFLFDLDEHHGRAEIGYWIAPDRQGNGYATAAAELLVEYCFAERRLHKVNARVLAFNDASRAVLKTVGFQREGRRRDEFYVDGRYVDADLYGIVAAEWAGFDGAGHREGGD